MSVGSLNTIHYQKIKSVKYLNYEQFIKNENKESKIALYVKTFYLEKRMERDC